MHDLLSGSVCMLACVSQRLQEAKPEGAFIPFGRVSVILFGDDAQLPCVQDRRLFDDSARDTPSIIGRVLYTLFATVVPLDVIYRQADPQMQVLLDHVRDKVVTPEDNDLLRTRLYNRLGGLDKGKAFDDAPQLFRIIFKRAVELHNYGCLARSQDPVARIHAAVVQR